MSKNIYDVTTKYIKSLKSFIDLNFPFTSRKKAFSYRGCGWRSADHELKSWTEEKKNWVLAVSDLFDQMFGTDFLTYSYDKEHGTVVDEKVISSLLEYCHDFWEKHYSQESTDPQDDSKHLCHPRVNLVSADDPRQILQKQQPPPKHTKYCNFAAKLNDQADLVINAQGDAATAAQPMPAPKENIQRSVSEDNFDSINDPSPLQSSVIIEDDQDDSETSQETTLEVAVAKATTRAEVAALFSLIPPIVLRSPCLLQPVYGGKLSLSDPYSLAKRPCSSDIENARKILNNERKVGKNPRAIDFQGIGQFSENALSILT